MRSKQMTSGNSWGGRQMAQQQDYPTDPTPGQPRPEDLPNNPPRPVPGEPNTTTNPAGQPQRNPGERANTDQ